MAIVALGLAGLTGEWLSHPEGVPGLVMGTAVLGALVLLGRILCVYRKAED